MLQHHDESKKDDETSSNLQQQVSEFTDDENLAQYQVVKENSELQVVEDIDSAHSATVLGAEKKSRSKRWSSGCCNGELYSNVRSEWSGCTKTCEGRLVGGRFQLTTKDYYPGMYLWGCTRYFDVLPQCR